MKRLCGYLLLLAALFVPASPDAADEKRRVLALTVTGVINPVIGEYIAKGLEEADATGAAALLIRLDTPGGLLDSTRSAVSAMINAEVPVIVYVAPRGARATSAGVFLMMAADIAAMAPETHLGAAHPVTIGGDEKKPAPSDDKGEKKSADKKGGASVMEEKMVSDAAAYIRTLAEERGRNAAWAEKAVRDSVSLTATEALDQKVIDILAASEEELFRTATGRSVKKNSKELKIDLDGVVVAEFPMTRTQKLLHMLGHPNVAYILMTIGIYGLIYELAAPGIGLGGAVGGICLLLAFFSLQVLPLNAVGIGLIVLGIALLILELIAPSQGLLTMGGLIAFAMGSFFMIDAGNGLHFPRVSLPLILSTVATTALFFGFAMRQIWATRRTRPQTGAESLVGSLGTVEKSLSPEGLVDLAGELWTARPAGASIEKGTRVRVIRMEGNVLVVDKTTIE